MSSNQRIEETSSEHELFSEGESSQSKWIKYGAVVCALGVAAALLAGYNFLHKRQTERVRATQQAAQQPKAVQPPEAQIFEDEARLKGTGAVISGTVRNISDKRLEDLSLAMELKSRTTQATEMRNISVEPSNLAPGEEGRYSLTLPAAQWSGARVASLNSAGRGDAIVFKSAMGERRPQERLPQTTKVIIVPRPKPAKGEEFINTPDNPVRIP